MDGSRHKPPGLSTLLWTRSALPAVEFDNLSQVKSDRSLSLSPTSSPSRRSRAAVADISAAQEAIGSPSPASPVSPSRFGARAVRCGKGHVMSARVARELWLRRYSPSCSGCACSIPATAASYLCKACKYHLCLDCASPFSTSWATPTTCSPCGSSSAPASPRRSPATGSTARAAAAAVPVAPRDVTTGDILLAGPDWWGIHHIILCRGPMVPASAHMARQMVRSEPKLEDFELFQCATIESSRPLKGERHPWYAATSYYGRRRSEDGGYEAEFWAIGDVGEGSSVIGINNEFIPVKLLLHPCRPGRGGPPLNADLFKAAVEQSAEASKRWSRRTALSAITARRSRLQATDYADPSARAKLMSDIRNRWRKGPICSSVAIQIWQRYFDLSFGSIPGGEDLAARHILKWMPVLCDKTAPSALLKALSTCGWALCENVSA